MSPRCFFRIVRWQGPFSIDCAALQREPVLLCSLSLLLEARSRLRASDRLGVLAPDRVNSSPPPLAAAAAPPEGERRMASPSSFRGDGAYLLQASHQNQGTPYKIFVHIIEARGLISKSATPSAHTVTADRPVLAGAPTPDDGATLTSICRCPPPCAQ